MTATSAIPENLTGFAQGPDRNACSFSTNTATLQYQAMCGACGGYGVQTSNLASLANLLGTLEVNEKWVGVIGDTLKAADTTGSTTVTVASTAVATALQSAGLADVPPPVTVMPSTTIGVPTTSGFVDDPVCAANGNLVHGEIDLTFPGHAAALDVQRIYNSLATDTHGAFGPVGAFGPGWTSVADVAVTHVAAGEVHVRIPDGAVVAFRPAPGAGPGQDHDPAAAWPAVGRRHLQLAPTASGWALHESPERVWRFDADGRLTGADLGPARVTLRYRAGRLWHTVEEHSGRSVRFSWRKGRIVAATSNDGRTVRYSYDKVGVLNRVAGGGGTVAYELDGPLIIAAIDADGVAAFRNVYDGSGRVMRQTSPFGRVTDYDYRPGGVTVITDQFGVANAMIHDRRGNLTSVVDTDGRAMRMVYDHADRNTAVTDRGGNTWRYEFDDTTDDLLARIDPDGRRAEWTWDAERRLITETDRAGGVITSHYRDGSRTPYQVVTADGGISRAEHDERGTPTSIVDADGVATRLEWDDDGQPTAVIDALGCRVSIEYDSAGQYTRMVDAAGAETTIDRDAAGRILRHVAPGAVSRYRYSPAGRVTGGTEPGSDGWTAELGAHGKPLTFTDALGSTVGFEYDTNGNTLSVVAPDGAVYRSRFDSMGQLIESEDPAGAVWTRTLDADGHLVGLIDGIGRRMTRTVDAWGRTLISTAPDGAVTTYTYHPTGGIATVTGPDGRRWTTEVDACGRETAVIDPAGRRSEVTYTPAGRVAARRSPAGRTERYTYDAAGRLATSQAPDGSITTITRDDRGRIIRTANPDDPALTAVLTWDPSCLPASIADATTTVSIGRDSAGAITSVTDGTGVRSAFEWDARGSLATAIGPAGNATRYAYDGRGRLSGEQTPGGAATAFGYDVRGYLDRLSEPASGTTRLERDAVGNVTALRRSDGSGWAATLDGAGRSTALIGPDLATLATYAYDDAGRPASAVSEDGFTTTFLWDDSDDLIGVDTTPGAGGGSTPTRRRYVRDADGLVVAEEDQDGYRIEYRRDANGVIQAIVDPLLGELAVPEEPHADRDAAGRLLAGPDGTAYRYDAAGRLAERVGPDGVATTFRYDTRDLLAEQTTADTVRRYGYDDAGRLTGIVDQPGGRTSFTYDPAGRRISERWADDTQVAYRWDGLGQLVGIVTTHPAGAVETVDIDIDAVGTIVGVDGADVSWDIARTDAVDRIGSQRFLRAGAAVVARTGQAAAGRVRLTESGELAVEHLVMLRARAYDSRTRQFLSPDPVRPAPGTNGSASPYTYAWHDPINYVDPSGLRPISQEEFDAIRKREEQGNVGAAWEAVKKDPWGSAAMIGIAAVGVGLCFVPGGQAIGVGILIGVGTSAAMGVATGTFNPRAVAVNGLVGAVTGGVASAATTLPRAIAIGAATSGGGDVATQYVTTGHVDPMQALIATGTGGLTGGIAYRYFPSGTETYYRGMSDEHAAQLASTGRVSATGETMVSPTKSFADSYGDTTVKVTVRRGTTDTLEGIGVRDSSALTATRYPDMPEVAKGWSASSAYFKGEGQQINIGLGRGPALDAFNKGMFKTQVLPR